MINSQKKKVLLLHRLIAEDWQGASASGMRLSGVPLENVFRLWQAVYPAREGKGARLGYALIFVRLRGWQQSASVWYMMLTFLEVSGIRLDCASDLTRLSGRSGCRLRRAMDYEALLAWVAGAPCQPVLTEWNWVGGSRTKQRKIRRTCVKTQQVNLPQVRLVLSAAQRREGG